jgi:uncharacterized protein (DUF1015 family)
MPVFLPFKALLPHPDFVQHTILESEYIFDSESKQIERAFNPYSFWPVLRPVAYGPDQKEEFAVALEASHKRLQQLMSEGVFLTDESDAFYIYQVNTGTVEQTGIVGLVSAADYAAGQIKKHEKTREDREVQLSHFLEQIGINTTPVNLTYKNQHEVDLLLQHITQTEEPFLEAIGPQQFEYKIWRITDQGTIDDIIKLFQETDAFYIADGHHRAACASYAFHNQHSQALEFFSAILISSQQLTIFPFYRQIKKYDTFHRDNFLDQLKHNFHLKDVLLDQMFYQFLPQYHFLLCFPDKTYELAPKNIWEYNTVLERLDVSVLQEKVIADCLGITEITKDPRIAFGSKNITLKKFRGLLADPDTECILLCRAPEIDDIFEVSDQDGVMPPKSTSFEPKILSGLVMQIL